MRSRPSHLVFLSSLSVPTMCVCVSLAFQVSSRTLFVPWDPAGGLCPVADLLNHVPTTPASPSPPPSPSPSTSPSPSPLPSTSPILFASPPAPFPPTPSDCRCTPSILSTHQREASESREEEGEAAQGGEEEEERSVTFQDGSFDEESDDYRIYARQRYHPGEQVCMEEQSW